MTKVEIDKERCKGCSLCVVNCPKKIIDLTKDINKMGYHYAEVTEQDKCISCCFCATMCPDCAIKVN